MKFSESVTSSRRKNRKAHFASDMTTRRKLMSARLDKALVETHGVRSLPICKGDEVKIVRGKQKAKEGKVTAVMRKRFCIHVERVVRKTARGHEVQLPIDPSNCIIVRLGTLKGSRATIIDRKREGRAAKIAKLGGGIDDVE